MLKSILLAGALLVSSNFLPATTAGVPTVVAANVPVAPVAARPVPVASLKTHFPASAAVKAQISTGLRDAASAADGLAPEEREFIERVNAERTERGLNALALDPLLVAVARSHSREMCDRDYFDHHSPTPGITTPMDRFLSALHGSGEATPRYVLVGENIYYCSVSTPVYNVAYGHQALMNSPGHRANILEPRFAKIGVGIYRDARGQFWVTEMFLRDTD